MLEFIGVLVPCMFLNNMKFIFLILTLLSIFELTIFPALWGINRFISELDMITFLSAKEAVNILFFLILCNIILTIAMIYHWKNEVWENQIQREIWRKIFFDPWSFFPGGVVYCLSLYVKIQKLNLKKNQKKLLMIFLDFLNFHESLFIFILLLMILSNVLIIVLPIKCTEVFQYLKIFASFSSSVLYVSVSFLFLFNLIELSHFVSKKWDDESIYDYYFSSIIFRPFKHPNYYKEIMRGDL